MAADQAAKDLAGLKLEDSDSTEETRVDANDQTGHDSVDQAEHDSVDQKGNCSVDQTGRDSPDHVSVSDRETGGVAGREAAAPSFSQDAGPVADSETGPNDQSQNGNTPPSTSDQSTQGARGFVKCDNTTCQTCKIAITGVTFTDRRGTMQYPINGTFYCTSQSIVYVICCKKCRKQYVGNSTEEEFHTTIERHIRGKELMVDKHFKEKSCGYNGMNCFVIEQVPETCNINKRRNDWKKKLNTKADGLNER